MADAAAAACLRPISGGHELQLWAEHHALLARLMHQLLLMVSYAFLVSHSISLKVIKSLEFFIFLANLTSLSNNFIPFKRLMGLQEYHRRQHFHSEGKVYIPVTECWPPQITVTNNRQVTVAVVH